MAQAKIIATSDWHLRRPRPVARTDEDFMGALLKKVRFVINLAREEDAILALAGDLFDSARATIVPYEIVAQLINLFRGYDKLLLAAGQHDMRYHQSSLENTPFQIIETVVFPRGRKKQGKIDGIYYTIVDWGEEIPEPEGHPAVLIIHETVLKGNEPFAGVPAKELLKNHDYDLIISGDNHKRFTARVGHKLLVNSGSLARLTIDQKDFEPQVAKIEWTGDAFEIIDWITVPHEKDVFIDLKNNKQEELADVSEFIEKLAQEKVTKRDFLGLVREAAREHDLVSILDKVLKRADLN